PSDSPFMADAQAAHYSIDVAGQTLDVGAASMGNPHVVLQVANTETAAVESLGPLLEAHPRFPNRVNVGFMEIIDRQHFRLRVFERGVGETLACGSGACAAMAVGVQQGLLDSHATAKLNGGELELSWQGEGHPVIMTGPATTVFEGQVRI
ncbi:MAG: diaminopimelate epimerase, partial [Paracoccaceae bacterium]